MRMARLIPFEDLPHVYIRFRDDRHGEQNPFPADFAWPVDGRLLQLSCQADRGAGESREKWKARTCWLCRKTFTRRLCSSLRVNWLGRLPGNRRQGGGQCPAAAFGSRYPPSLETARWRRGRPRPCCVAHVYTFVTPCGASFPGHSANYETSYLRPRWSSDCCASARADWFTDYDALLLKSLMRPSRTARSCKAPRFHGGITGSITT